MHGTTSGLTRPHSLILRSSNNDARCTGRTRSALLHSSGRPLREVFQCGFPLSCTNRQLSEGKGCTYFIPSRCCNIGHILTNSFQIVKCIFEETSHNESRRFGERFQEQNFRRNPQLPLCGVALTLRRRENDQNHPMARRYSRSISAVTASASRVTMDSVRVKALSGKEFTRS